MDKTDDIEFIEQLILGREKTASEKLFDKVIEVNGKEKQLRQLQEECAELIVAVNHYLRTLNDKQFADNTAAFINLIEETADVEIMLAQLLCMFMLFENAVEEIKAKKLKRLEERIRTK